MRIDFSLLTAGTPRLKIQSGFLLQISYSGDDRPPKCSICAPCGVQVSVSLLNHRKISKVSEDFLKRDLSTGIDMRMFHSGPAHLVGERLEGRN